MNDIQFVLVDKETDEETGIGVGKLVGYFGILAILCILAFLVAKYIVRSNIDWEETPIDTSERI